jgi:molybdate transport system ATP-binding protein
VSLEASVRVSRGGFDLDVDLAVRAGGTLALLGPNGAGKSTALAALAGVVASTGTIRLGGRVLDGVPVEQRRIGYVFQDYLLFPHLSVLDNVAFGPRSTMPKAASRNVASEWLERLGAGDLATRRPAELSGGQAQRVALARALAADPELLLLDEPLAALDAEVRSEVREQLAAHLAEWSGPTIVVTHSLDDVAALAHDVVVVEGGRATQRGTVRDLVRSPATSYVERLVARWSED